MLSSRIGRSADTCSLSCTGEGYSLIDAGPSCSVTAATPLKPRSSTLMKLPATGEFMLEMMPT